MPTLTITPQTGQAFTFGHLEIPSAINFGGEQMEYTHKLPGGVRTVNAIGFDFDDITWSGYFDGITAVFRARYLQSLAIAGKPVTCSYDQFTYTVLIKKFTSNFQYLPLPYTITLRVIADLTTPITLLAPLGFDDAILEDLYSLLTLAELVQFGGIQGQIAALAATLEALASIAGASDATIAAVTAQLTAITGAVGSAAAAISAKLFGGGSTQVFPGSTGAPMATSDLPLDVQADEFNQLVNLYQMQYLAARMTKNFGLLGGSANSQTVTLANANLYKLAAQYYSDATLWTVIRDANGLNDFIVSGINTLIIPAKPPNLQ